MTDLTFVPILEKIADQLPSVERYIVLHRQGAHAADHAEKRRGLRGLDRGGRRQVRMEGVRREHRSGDVLHIGHHGRSEGRAVFAPLQRAARADGQHRSTRSAPVPPTQCCRWCRCSMPTAGASPSPRRRWAPSSVLPGAKLDGASVYELLSTEKVTHTAGVPTVWLMLLNHMAANNLKLPHLQDGGLRRLGDAALDDQGVRRHGRRRAPRLGHDRDEPDRHAWPR